MDGDCLIASVADNSYYLHCLDTKKNSMDLIKQEKVELVVSPPKVFRMIKPFELMNR